MRVLAGRYKSKLIRTINDPLTRPMMSRVRESIFNSLQFNIENKDILDLYAGSGSLGIESLSRDANFVTFIENSDDCITILKQNLKEFGNNYKITKSSVDKFLQTSKPIPPQAPVTIADFPLKVSFIIILILFLNENFLVLLSVHKQSQIKNILCQFLLHPSKINQDLNNHIYS